jgi:hypothetical protein
MAMARAAFQQSHLSSMRAVHLSAQIDDDT